MDFVNLTPHPITIKMADGGTMRVPASGTVARVLARESHVRDVMGIPVIHRELLSVEGLPEPRDGAAYIVSSMVVEAILRHGGRDDVFAPDAGPTAIRDDEGHIVAVTRLITAS